MTDTNNCRMHERVYPVVNELVLVKVASISEIGVYAKLVEYNNIEGLILLSELSRRRIRSIGKIISVGRVEVVVVVRVDSTKGYIDLSKKRVEADDIVETQNAHQKIKAVHSIMRHVAEKTQAPLLSLYETWGWDLYRRFGHAHEAFKKLSIQVFNQEAENLLAVYNLDTQTKDCLIDIVKRRFAMQPGRIRADLIMSCFSSFGIDGIIAGIRAAESCSTSRVHIKIRLVSPPSYVMLSTVLDTPEGIAVMEQACSRLREVLSEHGGELIIKTPPRAIDDHDDEELAAKMVQAQKELGELGECFPLRPPAQAKEIEEGSA